MAVDTSRYADSLRDQNRFQLIYDALPPNPGSILDVGCARGSQFGGRDTTDLHEFLLQETSADVMGIDIDEEAIEQMKEDGYDVAVADAQSFALDETFDAIVAGEVIEYLPNPGGFIDTSLNHLSQDGFLIFTTENPSAFTYWRKSLQNESFENTLWIEPKNIKNLHPELSDDDVHVTFRSPTGGVSSFLWKMGYTRASSPGYCAKITKRY